MAVAMVGGSIRGETKTVAIYDRAQAFDFTAAGHVIGTLRPGLRRIG